MSVAYIYLERPESPESLELVYSCELPCVDTELNLRTLPKSSVC